MATLHHEVWIDAPLSTVYRTLSTPEGIGTWWDEQKAVEIEDGTVLEHDPGPEHGVVKLKVLERTPNRKVVWECISRHGPKSPASAWTGTRITFELTRRKVPGWSAKQTEKDDPRLPSLRLGRTERVLRLLQLRLGRSAAEAAGSL